MRFLHTKLLISALLLALSAHVDAQQTRPNNLQAVPDVPPPPPGIVDPAFEPQISIKPNSPDGNRGEEYRIKGKLYMIKVTPPHGTPYFLVDERGDGNFLRQGPGDPKLRVPQWLILQF